MKRYKSNGERVFSVCNVVILVLLSVVSLYPMLYCVFASFSEPSQMVAHTGLLFRPLGFSLAAYKEVFGNSSILIGYRNTLFILVVGIAVNMTLTCLAAYVLSRKGVLLNGFFTMMILITMYISGGLVPTYLVVRGIGLYDTLWALILPTAVSTYNLIIMRTGFAAVPDSLEESARIDGANHFTIMVRIFIPLAKSTIAVLLLYYAVSHWNSWFNASIYLKSRDLYPLQLILREILISNDTSSMTGGAGAGDVVSVGMTIQYATIMVATVPILVVYPFIQKYFVTGVMIGAVKG